MKLTSIILAAGQGTRMRSRLPKVLHPIAGRPMLGHVIAAAQALHSEAIHVVYGHGGETVKQVLAGENVRWVEQAEQLGTGHAVEQAMPEVPDDHTVLVLYGDVPLITGETLSRVAEAAGNGEAVAVLTVELDDPAGYGRIVRSEGGQVRRIVEQKDASTEEQAIREINTGLLAAPAGRMKEWLARCENNNAQGEYYLTDIIAMAAGEGFPVKGVLAHDPDEVAGVNDRVQLARLERVYQSREAERLMRAGATLADPARVDVRGELSVGRDCSIDVNCVFEGRVVLGEGVRIGPNCLIRDSEIQDGAEILANSVLEEVKVGPETHVGPFARLRPGTVLARGAKVGNFVETKQAEIGEGSKVNHLSYVGDARLGRGVNVGAGTITCNYDGANKHLTVIEDDAFIGSDTQLVAPVTVGAGATLGAGTTLTQDAPAGQLTISRARQRTFANWERPTKEQE